MSVFNDPLYINTASSCYVCFHDGQISDGFLPTEIGA